MKVSAYGVHKGANNEVEIWFTGGHIQVLGLHIKICLLGGIWGDQQPPLYFGTPSISPKLIELGIGMLVDVYRY